MKENSMELKFCACSENEAFARTCVASFCLGLNPSVDDLNDIKTAVSEAVTNCVVHAYPNKKGDVFVSAKIDDGVLTVCVADNGVGIDNFDKAKEAFYTTKPKEERSGLGFTIMESFMDKMVVEKNGDKGVKVTLVKRIVKKEKSLVGDECVRSV